MKKIGVLTSGGDASGMNSAIRSVVRTAQNAGLEVVGFIGGFQGLIDNDFVMLNSRSVGNILYKGGTILKTSRCEEFKTDAGIKKSVNNLKKDKVDGLVVIGGDGSYHGCLNLEKQGIKVAFIPGTIDNNMYYTDRTIGFDTACNTVVNLVNNIRDTNEAHNRISVVEVMGSHCGDLALEAGIACGADFILVPEVKVSNDKLYKKLNESAQKGKKCSIVVLNEKVCSAETLVKEIQKNVTADVKSVVLGHIQRGGTPTCLDRVIATKLGLFAVNVLLENKSGAVGVRGFQPFVVELKEASKPIRKFNADLLKLAGDMAK